MHTWSILLFSKVICRNRHATIRIDVNADRRTAQ